MDENDFVLTIDETFEEINRQLDELAIDDLDVNIENQTCVIEFSNLSCIRLSRSQNESTLLFESPSGQQRTFYYHGIEECWFDRNNEEELRAVLKNTLEANVGTPITFVAA